MVLIFKVWFVWIQNPLPFWYPTPFQGVWVCYFITELHGRDGKNNSQDVKSFSYKGFFHSCGNRALGCMIECEPDPWKIHLNSTLFPFPAEFLVENECILLFCWYSWRFISVGSSHINNLSFTFGVDLIGLVPKGFALLTNATCIGIS